jgi:hypothetical protein
MLFQPPHQELSDDEIAEGLRHTIAGLGGSRVVPTSFSPASVRSTSSTALKQQA